MTPIKGDAADTKTCPQKSHPQRCRQVPAQLMAGVRPHQEREGS